MSEKHSSARSRPRIRKNRSWAPILERAAEIVNEYTTGVTLRQLFYRLVAEQILPNVQVCYRQLSSKSAKARRQGRFPDLIDQTRRIRRPLFFDDAEDAKTWLAARYRLDRSIGQRWSIYLGVEKKGIEEQLFSTFNERGLPIVALGGFTSQTLEKDVKADIDAHKRPAVLIYAGDLDPSGNCISQDFINRVGYFDKAVRVAVTKQQMDSYPLPFNPDPQVMKKLARDPRANAFKQEYGSLFQIELDALPPADLMNLYTNAVAHFWDEAAFQRVLRQEAKDRARL